MLTANKADPEQNDFENTVDTIVDAWFDLYASWLVGTDSVKLLKEQLKTTLQDL